MESGFMEESKEKDAPPSGNERFIIRFGAATGFTVVLEFAEKTTMEEYEGRIAESDLDCIRIPTWNAQFDQADLYMDLRHPECQVQFDLEDWI